MYAFVVLCLVFSMPCQEIGLGKRLGNDLFCVEWGVKPQLIQSTCGLLVRPKLCLETQLPSRRIHRSFHMT